MLCLLVSLRSGPVTAVKFSGGNVVASSEDGSTKFWDLETGQESSEAVPEGFTVPTQGSAQEQRVNDYLLAAHGQTFCIFKTAGDKAVCHTDTPVAFFQCASEIRAFDVSELERSHIAVGCADGQVLQLRAAVLLT